MADDNNQRPYRTNETRATPTAAPTSGNDPLAELARLIGQSNPFAEFGRDTARRAAPAAETPSNWQTPPTAPTYTPARAVPESRAPAPNLYSASAPQPTDMPPVQPFGSAGAQGDNYADPYFRDDQQEAEEEDVYDDVPPPRRRMGVIAVAAVFALAVIGTAGAFGYRALFGSSGSHLPPPVIKADTTPSKVAPSTAGKDAQSNKLITDRLNDRGQDEKMVPRQEQAVDVKESPAMPQLAQNQGVPQSAPLAPAEGSGVVTSEPKKVHTITIRPEQIGMADTGGSAPAPVQAAPPPKADVATPVPRPAAPPPRAYVPPVGAETSSEPPPPVARPAPAAPARRTAASGNAPLSLSPGDAAPALLAPAAPPPARVAPQASSGAGSYAVQVSAQRSEAEAQAAFRNMQAKFPSQLGGRTPMIRQVDLGSKGVYFRAMVGPFASDAEAGTLCSNLKSAGGQCIVQKI
jgi:SPOR domain